MNYLIAIVLMIAAFKLALYEMDMSKKPSCKSYKGYSDLYKCSESYRKNVKDISDIYGISEKEADAKINRVVGGK